MDYAKGLRFWPLLVACVPFIMYQNCGSGFGVLTSLPVASTGSTGTTGTTAGDTSVDYRIAVNPVERLSQSSLISLTANDGASFANFWEYTPKYPLYSYGAAKRRWIYLPALSKINNANPDAWSFPTGTVFWKEFALDGKKIETRVFEKTGSGTGITSWRSSVYLWRSDQSDADLLKDDMFYSRPVSDQNMYQAGLVRDRYQIVAPSQCVRCHSSASDSSLGFNYFQLSNQYLKRNVLALSQTSWLTNSVSKFDEILGNETQKNAIGYMQSNCIMCHSGAGPGPHNFKHVSTVKVIEEEAIFRSMAASQGLITPGQPATSRLYQRFSGGTMPPGTLTPDTVGQNYLRLWIEGL